MVWCTGIIKCPECGSNVAWSLWMIIPANDLPQEEFMCKSCGNRFKVPTKWEEKGSE